MNKPGKMGDTGHAAGFDPRIEHRPAAYWFWSGIPSGEEITRQLAAIRSAGYGTFLIQPRLSFPRSEYLSETHLKAYQKAMAAARSLGLRAGLYDDYNWISGHAAGRTVAAFEFLRERHLFWTTARAGEGPIQASVSGIRSVLVEGLGPAARDWCYEGVPTWDDWGIFRAYLCPPPGADGRPVDVTPWGAARAAGPDGCRLTFDPPTETMREGWELVAFVTGRCANSRLINYLDPQAGERFIEVGYEPYKRALGGFFGDPLTFVFWDQPYAGFYNWRERTGNVACSLMFHPRLVDLFEETRGYPLGEALLGLALPDSDRSPRLRCDFFETYGRLARENFLGPIRDWSRENGLETAGHELLGFVGGWAFAGGLTYMDSRVNFGADYFAIDRYKTLSTVDACNYHPQLSARFGASAARSHGRRGCLIEQYTVPRDPDLPSPVGQWGLTLDELRAQAVRHTLLGARQFIFHAVYQTDGRGAGPEPMTNPGLDFPPGINYEPWFPDHASLARELGVLSEFMAGADEWAPVAVLYPLRTFWHSGGGHPFNRESALWNQWLYEHGPGVDIVDENELLADRAAGGRVLDRYRVLILPGVSVVKGREFADLIEGFAGAGGWVIATGPLPEACQERGCDPELAGRMRAFFETSGRAFHWPPLGLPFDDRHPAAAFFPGPDRGAGAVCVGGDVPPPGAHMGRTGPMPRPAAGGSPCSTTAPNPVGWGSCWTARVSFPSPGTRNPGNAVPGRGVRGRTGKPGSIWICRRTRCGCSSFCRTAVPCRPGWSGCRKPPRTAGPLGTGRNPWSLRFRPARPGR